jgi:hypothetical protein
VNLSKLRRTATDLISSPVYREWIWALPPVAGALLVMSQGLSNTRVFFDRDLSFYYWPEHLWMRDTIFAGELPLWDRYVAFGQTAIADPVRQILFFPTLPIRLFFPPVLGFNLLVVIPMVLAGLGAFRFFRGHLSPAAASFGATVFALSGPVLSTGNSLNLCWALALLPWILRQADKIVRSPTPGAVAIWAMLEGLQILAGEPVTAAVTAVVAGAYILFMAKGAPRLRRLGLAAVSIGLGALLVAVQLLPLYEATARSTRAQEQMPELLALHPSALVEIVAGPLFGDRFPPAGQGNIWLRALNGGLWPLFTSIYLGVGVIALAALAVWVGRRKPWCRFWFALALVAIILSLGRHTPVYPALQYLLPPVGLLRYPAKYLLPGVLGIAALAGFGWEYVVAQSHGSVGRGTAALILAALGGIGTVLAYGLPDLAVGMVHGLFAGLPSVDSDQAARLLVESVGAVAPRILLLGGLVAFLVGIGRHRLRSVLLFAVCFADLLGVNVTVNPTLDAELLREPPWVAAIEALPKDRVYVGGRVSWITGQGDLDDVPRQLESSHSRLSESAVTAAYQTMFATFPSAWALSEGISLDLTALWPHEYTHLFFRFAQASREERTRFLRRTGTRYFLTNAPPSAEARTLVRLVGYQPVALHEEPRPGPRVAIVKGARIEPEYWRQLEHLFAEAFDPAEQVLLFQDPPPPAGESGAPEPSGASVISESASHLEIQAHVGAGGGYLVVYDTFDSGWVATVGGKHASVQQANGLFRALRLAPGDHRVVFKYRPWSLQVGAVISSVTVLALALVLVVSRRRKKRNSSKEASNKPEEK